MRDGRLATLFVFVGVTVIAVAAGLLVGADVRVAALLVGAAVFAAAYITVPHDALPLVAAAVVFAVPFDFIGPFSADLQGAPVLGIALVGALMGLLFGGKRLDRLAVSSWDVLTLGVVFLVVAGVNGLEGGARQAGVLFSGILFYLWTRASHRSDSDTLSMFVRLLFWIGAVQGGLAVVGRLIGPETLAGLLPAYTPAFKDFAYTLGNRATAFAGHPLRLGTMCMTSLVAAIGLLRVTGGRHRVLIAMGMAASAAGLVLSGARGAWLAAVIAVIAVLFVTPGKEAQKLAVRLTVGGAAGYLILDAIGAIALLQERLFGVAARPASLAQRVGVLGASAELAARRPLLGYGFGTYLQEVFAQGFRYSNTENQYVDFLLAGGLLTLASYVLVVARGLVGAFRIRSQDLGPTAFGLTVGWSVSIATYNTFSWSAAFPVFMVLMAVIAGARD